jgi:DUF1365 family protein
VNSCLYVGRVRHRRRTPVAHAFEAALHMLYLDLDELPQAFDGRWLWSARRPAPAWFRRADFLGDARMPLATAVRELVRARGGHAPGGPVRLLTNLRTWGVLMNPVSFYYCFDAADERVEAIVAEVTNTPWNERHAYVLRPRVSAPGEGGATRDRTERGALRFELRKQLHVSPFMPMEQDYDWRFGAPARQLVVHMRSTDASGAPFDATLAMRRHALDGRTLAAAFARQPWISARIAALIYWNALRLWAKRVPFHVHPAKRGLLGSEEALR